MSESIEKNLLPENPSIDEIVEQLLAIKKQFIPVEMNELGRVNTF